MKNLEQKSEKKNENEGTDTKVDESKTTLIEAVFLKEGHQLLEHSPQCPATS